MGKNFRETLNEQLQDPEFRAEWQALEPERQIVRAIMEGRQANNLTQEQLADESHVSTKQIADIEKARRNPSYLILKALAKVVHLSLDSLMYPDLSPDEAGQNEMKLLYMNCPPEMRETLLHHTRGFAEELKELAKKLEAK